MRVAFLTHEPFYPPSGGGSAEAVYLVQELIQRGHDVHLFCPAFPEPERIQRLFAAKRTASSSISSAIGLPSKLHINRPAPGPSQECGKQSSAPRKFPSGEGSGAGSDVPGANVDRGDLCAPEAATGGDSAGLQCHLFTTWP